MIIELAVTTIKKLYPEDYWVDSLGNDLIRVLDPDGKLLVQLPLGSALTVLLEAGVLKTPADHFSSVSWDMGDIQCFGAQNLAAASEGYRA